MALRSAVLVSALALAAPAAAATQAELDSLAKSMVARLAILDNKPAACPHQPDGCFLSELSLKMPPELGSDLASGDFQIYFSSVAPIIEVDSDAFTVRLINGDLHVLEPRKGARLEPGRT